MRAPQRIDGPGGDLVERNYAQHTLCA